MLVLHHLCFYEAIHRLPLGVAVTLEFAGARQWSAVGWAVLAAAGVAARRA